MTTKNQLTFAAVAVVGFLAGCGGGGSDAPSTSAATAEGAYSGAITNSTTASAFSAVVLDDGQVWALYGNNVGGSLLVLGLLQGQGASNNGAFTSTTIKDFGASPVVSMSLNATYVAGASVVGAFTTARGASIGINGIAIPPANFNYNSAASLVNVMGNWNMSSTSGNAIALNIAASGAFTGTATGGCTLSGSLSPRPSGKNVYNVQMTIGPAPCALPGFTGGGIGIYSTLANGSHQLILASVDSSRTYGSASFGTR